MGPEASAILTSAAVTGVVAAAGAVGVAVASRRNAALAALAAPVVVVASLSAGVAAATRSMLIGEHDYRTVLFILAAGAPLALLIGVVLARRVSALERQRASERADRKRAAQVEDSRREMIRWLSHDLRTPLAGIRAVAELMGSDPAPGAPAEDLVVTGRAPAGATIAGGAALRATAPVADTSLGTDIRGGGITASVSRILAETDRMDAMVDDIAELSRLQAGQHTTEAICVIGIDDLVSDAVSALAAVAESARVRLVAGRLDGALVAVEPRLVTRAVTNIVRNAVAHTPAGGTVTVTTAATMTPTATDDSGGSAVSRCTVSVLDECGGIPPEDLTEVVKAGWRGDHSRRSDGRGMGLGLTIADEVARAHGGSLRVVNLPDGRGCAVSLDLPRHRTP